MRITNYLDVVSSWCLWAEPMWTELQRRYAGRVAFDWKIALMDESGMPKSRAQLEWYYHRSGTMMQSSFDLNSGWYEEGVMEYLAPNAVAEAARELGITDDSVRIALSIAGLREGRHTGQWEIAAGIGAATCGIDKAKLLKRAKSRALEERLRATTAEFHALQITQRPAFVIDSEIGDRAVFSGFAKIDPLATTIDAMLEDLAFYKAHGARFGKPPEA
ncbi:MAG: DsbA family protein [Chthoniobacterales bacterium]|nr:DsbA family protein [Chthoniobacterales bacterium]